MHRLIYVAVPRYIAMKGKEELEGFVGDEMAAFDEELGHETGEWEDDTALFELISPSHPEASKHLDPELLMDNPYQAICEAFVSMESTRCDHVTGGTYKAATNGLAIFDAREYVTVGRGGVLSTDKISPDWKLMSEAHKKPIFNGDTDKVDYIYTKAASLPKYVLKSLSMAGIDEICFLDVHGDMAIGRSILNRAKWDWFEIGGRWKNFLHATDGNPTVVIPTDNAERARTQQWNPDILTKFFEVAETYYATLQSIEGWENACESVTDMEVEFKRGDYQEFYDATKKWLNENFPIEDIRKHYDDSATKMGVDVDYTVKVLAHEYLIFWMFSGGWDMYRELMSIKLNVPTALLVSGEWHEYDSYHCKARFNDIESTISRGHRFKEDVSKLDADKVLVLVDIHY